MTSRRLLASLSVLSVVALGACNPVVRQAKTRVETVMEGFQKDGGGSGGYMQAAVAQWAGGPHILSDQDALGKAEVRCKAWADQKGLYRKITSFKVLDAKAEGDTGSIVTVNIEGKTYQIRVPPRDEMSWAD